MKISIKKALLFVFLALGPQLYGTTPKTSIKAVFWSKPGVFYQDRFSMFKSLGFLSSILNAGRAPEVQKDLFDKLSSNFGVQTQAYKANDPESNKPLPLIMRQWLTGEKSAHEIRHAARNAFKDDSFMVKITDIVFTPNKLVEVTSILTDGFNLVKRIKQAHPGIKQILASNYDPASFAELQKATIGKTVLPHFNVIYNSGMLKSELRGLVLQDPAFFRLIMTEQNLQPQECLVINTDPDIIRAAQSLGMRTIQYKHNDLGFVKTQLKQMGLIS